MKRSKPACTPARFNACKCMESRYVYQNKKNNGESHFSYIKEDKKKNISKVWFCMHWAAPCSEWHLTYKMPFLILLMSQVLKALPFTTASTAFWSRVEELDCNFPALSFANLDKCTQCFCNKSKANFQRREVRNRYAFQNWEDSPIKTEDLQPHLKLMIPVLLLAPPQQ